MLLKAESEVNGSLILILILSLCLWTIGAIWTLLKLVMILKGVYAYTLRPSCDLLKRYSGPGTWAVVTGATEGFGLGYSKELARCGFNVLMVARNAQKLEERKEEVVKATHTSVVIRTIVLDFNAALTYAAYVPLAEELKDKRVAVLVNNVAVLFADDFHTFSHAQLVDLLHVNVLATTFVTRLVLPHLLANPKRGAVVTISASLAQAPVPFVSVYAATKAYVASFTRALEAEYGQDKLDFVGARKLGRLRCGTIVL